MPSRRTALPLDDSALESAREARRKKLCELQQYVLASIIISSVFYVIFASAWHMATSDRPPAYKPRPYLGFGGN